MATAASTASAATAPWLVYLFAAWGLMVVLAFLLARHHLRAIRAAGSDDASG